MMYCSNCGKSMASYVEHNCIESTEEVKSGEIYTVEIGFNKQKHCLQCPLRNKNDDTCNLQTLGDYNLEFDSWELQMLGCPLKFNREVK